MDLILETGAGVVGANSYASVAYADEYFTSHPFYSEAWDEIASGDRKKALLIAATSMADSLMAWQGYPVFSQQTLRWPRYGVRDRDDRVISQSSVPEPVRQAVCEIARWLSSPDANPDATDDTAGIEELRIDVIQLKFGSSSARRAVPSAALRLLGPFGSLYSRSRVRRVQVAL
jgi:hypothetical protein